VAAFTALEATARPPDRASRRREQGHGGQHQAATSPRVRRGSSAAGGQSRRHVPGGELDAARPATTPPACSP
jgi:hypothetical protein